MLAVLWPFYNRNTCHFILKTIGGANCTSLTICRIYLAEMDNSTMEVALLAAEPGIKAPAPACGAEGYITNKRIL